MSLVLCYHAVSVDWDAELAVRPNRLAWQIELLLRRGYRPLRFSELVNTSPHDRVFAVTFDDAFKSVSTLAAPILERLGVTATLFVPTDYVEAQCPLSWAGVDRWLETPYAGEMTPASWDEIRELRDAGWEIGAHSCSHPLLTRLSDSALAYELAHSKAVCEQRLDAQCTALAYPYGNLDDRVAAAAARAGYRAAGALPGEYGTTDPLQWPRVGIYSVDDERRFRLKMSIAVSRLRASGLFSMLASARARGSIAQQARETLPRGSGLAAPARDRDLAGARHLDETERPQ